MGIIDLLDKLEDLRDVMGDDVDIHVVIGSETRAVDGVSQFSLPGGKTIIGIVGK